MDRSARLVLFGILAICLGLISLGLALLQFLLVFAGAFLEQAGAPPTEPSALLMGCAVYGMVGGTLIWLGIGSTLKRRWACPLMLTVAWTWLACGLVTALLAPWLLSASLFPDSSLLSAEAMLLVKIVTSLLIVVFGVLVPAAFVWAYRDPAVHITCAARDPRPAWTERCPGPVLGLSVGLAACAALAVPMLIRPVVPLFAIVLTGWPAGLALLAGATACGYLARSTYRLEISGWWGAVALFALIGAATAVSFATLAPAEIYGALGYPEEQVHALEGSASAMRRMGTGLAIAVTAATLLYMSRVRKLFVARDPD